MFNFRTLLEDSPNSFCADCSRESCKWASINNGIFLCFECANNHKKLGVALSFVKLLTATGWSETQFHYLEISGNQRFLEIVGKYSLAALSLPDKYSSPAMNWHRKALRAQIEGIPVPVPPAVPREKPDIHMWGAAEEVKNELKTVDKPDQQNSWFGGLLSKAGEFANHTVTDAYKQSRDMSSALVEKSVAIGGNVGKIGEAFLNQFVEGSKKVGHSAIQRSRSVGERIMDQSKQAGLSLYGKSNEFLHLKSSLDLPKRKGSRAPSSARNP